MRRWLILALVLAGCGTSEEDAVRAALDASDRAVERQDYSAVCAGMTEQAQRRAARTLRVKTCLEAFKPPAERDGFGISEAEVVLEAGRVTDIKVDGDTATVVYDRGVPTIMRKVDGRWLFD